MSADNKADILCQHRANYYIPNISCEAHTDFYVFRLGDAKSQLIRAHAHNATGVTSPCRRYMTFHFGSDEDLRATVSEAPLSGCQRARGPSRQCPTECGHPDMTEPLIGVPFVTCILTLHDQRILVASNVYTIKMCTSADHAFSCEQFTMIAFASIYLSSGVHMIWFRFAFCLYRVINIVTIYVF